MNDPISVGLGECVVSRDRSDVLVAYGLGSCLGITMVDPQLHIAGMLHAVLPERMNGSDPLSSKYVDSGIEGLLEKMIKENANPNRLLVKMAGGANMLLSSGLSNTFDVGTRNINSAHRTFKRLGLDLRGELVGGNLGRTVRLFVAEGRMTVRVISGKELDL